MLRRIPVIATLLMIALGTGMAGYGASKSEESSLLVTDNVITFVKDAKLRLAIDEKFSYAGNDSANHEAQNANKVDGTYYTKIIQEKLKFVCKALEDADKKFILVNYIKFKHRGWSFSDDLFERLPAETILEKGRLNIDGENFKYVVYTEDNAMVKICERLLGVTGGKRLSLLYIEILPKELVGTQWEDASQYTDEQRAFAKKFMTSASEAFLEAPAKP